MTTPDPFDLPADADAVRALAAVPPVAPPAELFDAVLGHLPAVDGFRPTGLPGVSVRVLRLDRAADRFDAFVRLAPGAALPPHTHDGPEACVVLDGTVTADGQTLVAGDWVRFAAGTPHAEQVSAGGCLLFLSGPLSLVAG